MREGYRIYDTDTHIDPAADVLERYVDPGFRPRLADLAPYRVTVKGRDAEATPRQSYDFGHILYERTLGEANPQKGSPDGRTWRGERKPGVGVMDDRSDNRVADMDLEGSDVHFLVPSTWTSVVGLPDAALEIGLVRAYHRYMAEFCAAAPDRLKGPIIASGRAPQEAVREIRDWGKSNWAVAVQPLLDNDLPVDHPALEPIWQAAQEHDLAVVHHSFTWSPPFFPGYQDMWDNVYIARLCSHPWGAMRFLGGFLAGGILDRHPGLRLAVLECGFGWLPFWVRRMDEQVSYVGRTAKLKHLPSEHFAAGRVFCNIESHEREPMFTMVTGALGDGVLMFGSDYPHFESWFPHSVDKVLEWKSVEEAARRKLFWENARRCFKRI